MINQSSCSGPTRSQFINCPSNRLSRFLRRLVLNLPKQPGPVNNVKIRKVKITSKSGFTLVETIISLALLAVLFVLLGGLLSGMARISRTASDISVFDREIEFCCEIIRKELGEMVIDNQKADYMLLGGDEFLAYTTTRDELLVRDSIPGGVKRVEWRYDSGEKRLVRIVTRLVKPGSELPPVSRSYFLEGLAGIQFFYFDGITWFQLAGISSVIPQSKSIALRFLLKKDPDEKDTSEKKIYETAFWLPDAKP